ncbi:MAG: nucleotidyltransferase [Acidobacteria bacterium]|nr:nucleotidyltransferase [Acidobacteriota bacterium]
MVDPDDGAGLESRPPLLEDLLTICRALNERGARYVVVGGMAVIHAGFVRATEDIDLLVDDSPENFERIQDALSVLPDKAVREVRPTDLNRYVVVRVADEVVVDLMKSACGVDYAEAIEGVEPAVIQGVEVPFASPALLLKLKQTVREKDALDRQFLELLIAQKSGSTQ